jgi:hypothetical protein
MNRTRLTTTRRAALAAALALAVLFPVACSDEQAGNNSAGPAAAAPAANSSPAATGTPAAPTTGSPAPGAPPTAQTLKVGDTGRIEGRVINVICYAQNPTAPPEEAAECAKQQFEAGNGALAILGNDNVIYVSALGPRVANQQLGSLVGAEVIANGTVTEEATELSYGIPARRLKIRFVRRKDAPSRTEGTPKLVIPQKPGAGSPAPANRQ